MNTPNPALELKTDVLRGALRASKQLPRPIHHPETGSGGER
jgi:hypothetical protein